MSYSIQNVTQIADCDLLLTWAQKEKADLVFKKLSEERLINNYSSTSVEIEAVLQGVNTELSAIDTIINSLPDGPTKEGEIKRKVRLEYKKFLLENRKESYGVVALLEKELDLERVNKELLEVETFITTVTDRRATFI